MNRLAKGLFTMSFFLSFFCSSAFALTTLKGEEAVQYLGELKAHLLSGKYTYEILSRSHRDAMYGRFSDGIIFNTDGGNFLYPRRRDGNHIVVVDSPQGREEEPVTEDNWRQVIQNNLSDDNKFPYVFLDDSKKEIAILYVGKGVQISSKMNNDRLLEISLGVPGSSDRHGARGRRLL